MSLDCPDRNGEVAGHVLVGFNDIGFNQHLRRRLVELVDDGTDTATDACEPLAGFSAGHIALIDRGACNFTQKVLNAQLAGAKGAIIVNNQPAGLPPMGGFDPAVTIPSVGVSFDDGSMFKAAAAENIVGKLILDGAFQAGATEDGLVRLYAPNPVRPGSSKSHWDTGASPNLLMEPFTREKPPSIRRR